MDETIVIAATKNRHKVEEISALMQSFGMNVVGRDEAGVPDFEVEESGSSFEENALLKAEAIYEFSGRAVIADDSGLMVDALDGAPGIYSARFAEPSTSMTQDEANNEKLLALLADVPDDERTARFVSAIAMIIPGRQEPIIVRGECPGRIIRKPDGEGGFGYDPLFVADINSGSGRSFARISQAEKNAVSHRAQALAKLANLLAEE